MRSGGIPGGPVRPPLVGAAVLVAALVAGACGGGDDGDAAPAQATAGERAATKRHDFTALERCVGRRADGATEPARGPLGLADDAFFVDLPSSPRQSAVVALDDDAHALVAAYRRLGSYGFVDQEGVNIVIAWQELPAAEDRAVIEPCL